MARSVFLVLISVLAAATLPAQSSGTAAIRGQVLDPSGASVRRTTRTDLRGYFTFADLPLTGEYQLGVAKNGFATKNVDNVRLRAGETAILNFTMAPESGSSEARSN